jgi:hypothetical protein
MSGAICGVCPGCRYAHPGYKTRDVAVALT